MKFGQKFILINEAPYNRLEGHTPKATKFIIVEIIDIKKNVPGEFNSEKTGIGYLAQGSDGYLYGYNYTRLNQGFGNTAWERYCSDEEFDKLTIAQKDAMVEDDIWRDIVYYQCPKIADFCKDKEFIQYCAKHQHHYYSQIGCKRCNHGMPEPKTNMNMTEHNWVGWYTIKNN